MGLGGLEFEVYRAYRVSLESDFVRFGVYRFGFVSLEDFGFGVSGLGLRAVEGSWSLPLVSIVVPGFWVNQNYF